MLAPETAACRAGCAPGAAAASGEAAPAAEVEQPPHECSFSRELESWVSLAHMLAAELASVESQLQDIKLRPEKAPSRTP